MKAVVLPAALLVLAACAGTAPGSSPVTQLVGKQLTSGADSFSYTADGKMQGTFGGEALNGVWRNEGGLFCRSGTLGAIEVPDACQTIAITGETATFTRTDGGRVTTYTFD